MLSLAQHHLWVADQHARESAVHNIPVAVRLRGALEVGALERSMGEVVRRHEVLRTVFRGGAAGEPVPVVLPVAQRYALGLVDLAELREGDREQALRERMREHAQRPFDLAQGPLLRAELARLGAREHVLLLCMHHIVSDGWSLGVLFRELSVLYAAYCRGEDSPLAELPVQYADYALWQRAQLRGELLEGHLTYWRTRLQGAPALLDLPTDRARPAVQSHRGARRIEVFEAALREGLRGLAREEGATLYMVLLAAFQVLLGRYAGVEDVVVGSPVAGRTQPELEGLVGLFANMLTLRTDLSGEPTFREALGRVREATLEGHAHQELPFERLVEELNPDRSPSHGPLVQVVFALQNTGEAGLRLQGLETKADEPGSWTGAVKFDLALSMREGESGLEARVEYGPELFERETIGRMLGHLRVLLEQVAVGPHRRIGELTLLTEAEWRQLLERWNATAAAFPERCIHELFEEQAERTPGAVAVVFEGEELTYAELHARANQLAHALRGRGVGPEVRVGLCVERSPEMVVGLLGVLKAGGAYVPLDPGYPAGRLAFMLEDSGVRVLLTQTLLEARLPEHRAKVLRLDADREEIAGEPESTLRSGATPDNLAYVIYTSGSTGAPKGVMVTHRGLPNLAHAQARDLGITSGDRVLQFSASSFDASVFEVVMALASGAALCMGPRHALLPGPDLARFLREREVTAATLPPSALAALPPEELPALRTLFTAGEACTSDLVARWAPGRRFFNLYGPTETTIWATAAPCTPGDRPPAIGAPIANTTAYVLDPTGEPAPVGVPGELYLGGAGLARGYLGRPDLTAGRFLPDPFGGGPGSRLYRTGDRVRRRADGALEFLGRADQQVKVRGFRIEPGEIEDALCRHPQVESAAVVVREDRPGDRRLVAYVGSGSQAGSPGSPAALESEKVEHWKTTHDDVYAGAVAGDPALDLTGWNSSYTGQPIPADEMREWAERTSERILGLHPRRVLEIGCGTGLLLFRVAPCCVLYHGTDLSPAVLRNLRRRVEAGGLPGVVLEERKADDFRGVREGAFDTVVMNSVVQYFPGVHYLLRVLEGAFRALAPGGSLFLGDVRSLPLLEAFHTSVELHRADPALSCAELRRRVQERVARETELVVDPALFHALGEHLPDLDEVEVLPKRGHGANELVRFRYDVVLRKRAAGGAPGAAEEIPWLEWEAEWTTGSVRRLLEAGRDLLPIRGVPNARVIAHVNAARLLADAEGTSTVADLGAAVERLSPGVHPEVLRELAEELGYAVRMYWGSGGADWGYDVVFHSPTAAPPPPRVRGPSGSHRSRSRRWSDYTNDPLRTPRPARLAPTLRRYLEERLPEHMVPSAFVVLERLPLTPNGKVDRRALPAPEPGTEHGAGYVAPRTPVEEILCGTWADVLGLERVGVHENFFELGGHSLLATRVISRVRQVLGVEVPPRALFSHPDVRGLAEEVERLRREGTTRVLVPLERVSRDEALALSFAQQRLWFLDRYDQGSALYNVPVALRLRGDLAAGVLERSVGEVVRRHESLRTVFRAGAAGEPVQVILPAAQRYALGLVDLAALPAGDREQALRERMRENAQRPFDLAEGPLLRAELVRLGPREHVLLLCMHHIVSDGWSLGVLFRELSELYAAYRGGEGSPLPELPVQYADFAVWQRAWLRGDVLEAQSSFWRERLGGAPALLDLPTDRPRPPHRSFRGSALEECFGVELKEGLQGLARREGATLYMVLLAGFQVLLGRYAGQEDVVVGSPIAGRTRTELEGLIGFFVNTLALRTDVSGDPSFRELLARVRETTFGAYQHQDLPFEKLVEELNPARSPSHTPLFQVMFVLQNNTGADLHLGDVEAERLGSGTVTAKFDLTLSATEGEAGLRSVLEYDTDLFDAGTIARMLEHLRVLLEGIAADPERRIRELELLGEDERRRVLEEWSGRGPVRPPGRCVHELFAEQAERTPDAVAVAFEGERLTYAELDRRANQLAHHLRGLGVGPEVRVGLCVERSPEMVVGLLGVLKAGGAYVPLDPGYPSERLAFMLRDAGVPVLLTQSSLERRLPGHGARVVRLDVDRSAIAREPAHAPGSGAEPQSLAYVIYTSGSTGRPKGVAIPHGGLTQYLAWAVAAYGSASGHGAPVHSSLSFDLTVTSLFVPLLAGEAAVLGPDTGVEALGAVIRSSGSFGFVKLTPGHLSLLLTQLTAGEAAAATGRFVVGGESLPGEVLARWSAVAPEVEVTNEYGPTETTVGCCIHTLRAREATAGGVPIGRPTPGTVVYVLDGRMSPCPVGVPGELYVGGGQLARGYLGRAALTAERFVPDPFTPEPGARLYRTGDRVRWRAGGTLEFLGRLDAQVKVRGFRVEPGEVEAVLAGHPQVREAAVLASGDVAGGKRLVAYVVEEAAGELSPDDLRRHLRESLPEYLVPSAFVLLEALPITPNGKLDRRALPAPELTGPEAGAAPRTPVEEVVTGIWAQVLGTERRPGVQENFFCLGGHSLLATRVVSRIREAFGVELPLRALFEAPTVAELAERVDVLLRAEARAHAPPLVPVPRDRPLPLSFAQQRLWLVEQVEPGTAAYTISVPLRLLGRVDAATLGRALDDMVLRHEALRTTFAATPEGAVQVVSAATGGVLAEVDLSTLPREVAEAEILRLADADALRPFDLERGPLFRATLLRADRDEAALLLAMHHAVSDGWSIGILTRELSALYGAYAQGRGSPLPELPFQYADFAVWQRGWLRGEMLERQIAWWKEQLAGAPPLLELPTDRPRSAVRNARGGRRLFALPAATLRVLRALSRREGATLFMTFLAAWQALLAKYGGAEDVVVGSPIAGRTHLELEGLIGFFVNTLPLRTDLSGDPPFGEVLRRTREATLGAYQHQDLPFEKLVEEMGVERSLTHTPLFQAVLSLQNTDRPEEWLGDVRVEPLAAEAVTARFDLVLVLLEDGEEIHGGITYRADLWDGETVQRMLDGLARLLEQAAADPSRRLSEIPLLGEEERRRVLGAWNDTAAEVPSLPVHERIAAQAARAPDSAAVVFGAETLTFAELEARANRLARHLRGLGVGPDERVGLLLGRSAEMVVGVLGILKAGAAYVALDPSWPDERLRLVLRDAGPGGLVTRAALAERIAGWGGATVRLDEDADAIGRESAGAPRVEVAPESLAYVTYTSGSTGAPKGVLVEHRGLSNYLAFFNREILGADGFALPLVSRLSFDAHVRQLYPPLLRGEPVWVLPEEVATDPVRVLEALGSRDRVSFGGVPSLWGAVLDAVESGERPAPRDLRAVLLGGEALSAELARRTLARFPGARIWNHYGPTEATVNTTVARVDDPQRITLGRPIANARVYLLDAHGGTVPVGTAGELYVGGAGVSRGYLGRPDLTAERFLPDPFSGEPGARLYRSGDRVRWLASGELEYLGRVDQQVKVRGFRIEPGEIEAVLARHPGVQEAVVDAREDERGARRLVGYVVAAEGAAPSSAAELRAYLGGHLPEYMVPAAIVVLERLPLSPNGKVDRRALPEPGPAGKGEWHAAPLSPAEEILAGIWSECLGVERVGADADFFALGGHSLAATGMISRVRGAFGVEVPLRAVFEAPVLRALAERIESLMQAGAGRVLPQLVHAPRGEPLPLSFAQQRLWFIEQLDPEAVLYNLPFAFRLRGALNVRALARSIGEVVRRHEVLRTRFVEVESRPVQVIDPPAPVPVPLVDLRTLPAEARGREAKRLAEAEVRHGFDLGRGPLLRVALLRLAADDWTLLLTVHHIVFDGWSTGVFNIEVATLYDDYAAGRVSSLPELAFQYGDYAVWQREWLAGEVLREQIAWWKERLAEAPPLLELPTDFPRPAAPGTHAARLRFVVPGEAARGLHSVARKEGATLFMALLAAWQVLLSRYAGQAEVVVGAPIAGRRRTEVEPLVGFFVNTLALRGDLSEDPPFGELLRRVRETTLGAYQHQDVPFEKLVEEVAVERSLSHSPLFQVMFAVQNHERTALRLRGLRVEPFPTEVDAARTDLGLTVLEGGEHLLGMLTYRTDLWEAASMERLRGHFMRLLEDVGAGERRLSELRLMGDEERAQVVSEWNRTGADHLRKCLHELFAEQARRTPHAAAVTFGAGSLTYAELDARSSDLARVLRDRGVGPETRVGLCVDRSLEMVVGVLGILGAGGAYVPLDPAYPRERLAYMLGDSGAGVLVTQQSVRERHPELGGAVVCLDGAPSPPLGGGGHGRAPRDPDVWRSPSPDNAAYVIYTSGSTGTPKGVVVPHGAVAVRIATAMEAFGVGEGGNLPQTASLSFDASVLEIFLALLSGATLHVVDRDTLLSPEGLRTLLRERRIDTWISTPALLERVADTDCPALRTVSTGGERCSGELAARWSRKRRLLNVYGPTETTVFATLHECAAGSDSAPPIGRPAPNARAYVLDPHGNPVPVGVPGELYLGGAGVARGYLGRPELTAEGFVPDPFGGGSGGRLYRTGDRVRWLAAGEMEFLGRVDQQVKIRGFRIEPGEVEAALATHPAVREAVAVVREDVPGMRRLVGYVVPAEGAEVSSPVLRAWLRERLPDYMVPAALVALDRIPLTSTGKTDRRALPAPSAGESGGYVPPRTPAEELVAEVWADVLGVERVGVSDGFFDLGGHSLMAMTVSSRLRAMRLDVPVRLFFQTSTLEAFVREMTARESSPGQTEQVAAIVLKLRSLTPKARHRMLRENQQRVEAAEASGSVGGGAGAATG